MKYINIISRLDKVEVYHMGGYDTLEEVRNSIESMRVNGEVIDYQVNTYSDSEIVVRYVIKSYDRLINDIYIIDTNN